MVMDTVRNFSAQLKIAMDGGDGTNSFFTQWNLKARELHFILVESRPSLFMPVPKEKVVQRPQTPSKRGREPNPSIIHLEDDSDDPGPPKVKVRFDNPRSGRGRLTAEQMAALGSIPIYTPKPDSQKLIDSCKSESCLII